MSVTPLTRTLYSLTASLLLLAGATFTALSRLPFHWIWARLQGTVHNSSRDRIHGLYTDFSTRAIILGILLMLAGILLLLLRRPLLPMVQVAADRLRRELPILRADAKRALLQLWMDRPAMAGLACILAVGLVLRLMYLHEPMRGDESAAYISFVSRGLFGLFHWPGPANHLLHTLLTYASVQLLGAAPWAIRLPALLAGMALIPVSFLTARRFNGGSGGLFAAAMVATAPFLVLYSVNSRGYSLMTLFTLLLLLIVPYMIRHRSHAAGVIAAIVGAAGMVTLQTMTFALAGFAIWAVLLAWRRDSPAARRETLLLLTTSCLLCIALTAILYLPVIVHSGLDALLDNKFVNAPPEHALPLAIWREMIAVWLLWVGEVPPLLQVIVAGAVLGGTGWLLRHRTAWGIAPFSLAAGALLLLLVMRVIPGNRTWIYFLPILFVLADAGVTALLSRWPGNGRSQRTAYASACLLIAIVSGGAVVRHRSVDAYASRRYSRLQLGNMGMLGVEDAPDTPHIAAWLKPRLRPGDRVVAITPVDTILHYYFLRLDIDLAFLYQEGPGTLYIIVDKPEHTFDHLAAWLPEPPPREACTIYRLPRSDIYIYTP